MFLVFESSFTDNSLFWLLTTPFFQLKSCFFFANHFSSCSETLFQFFFPMVVTSLKDVSPLKLIFFALFHKSVANIYFLKTTFNDVFHDFLQIFAGF